MRRAERGQAKRRGIALAARPAIAERRRTAPAARPAIKDVRALDVGLGQARGPIGHDIVGVIMGGVADRRVDAPVSASLGDLAGAVPYAGTGARAIEPSQVKVNWQPVARVEPS